MYPFISLTVADFFGPYKRVTWTVMNSDLLHDAFLRTDTVRCFHGMTPLKLDPRSVCDSLVCSELCVGASVNVTVYAYLDAYFYVKGPAGFDF